MSEPDEEQPAAEPAKAEAEKAKAKARGPTPLIVFSVAVAAAVIGTRFFLCIPLKLPSGGMTPTMFVGETFTYRRGGEPARGDVVVFEFPEDRRKLFVQRVIGVPGDVLEFAEGRPVINGWPVPRCAAGRITYEGREMTLEVEFLGAHAYGVLREVRPEARPCSSDGGCPGGERCVDAACVAFQGPFPVAEGHVFAVGDNRDNSYDSRVAKQVPRDHVLGRTGPVVSSPRGDRFLVDTQGDPMVPGAAEGVARCLGERPASTVPPAK